MTRKREECSRDLYSDAHICQLRTGWDFLSGAWGDDVPHSEETMEEMRAAWSVLRSEVEQRHREHWGDNRKCWAAREFDNAAE